MNKSKALRIAHDASREELRKMLERARTKIADWRAPSAVFKSWTLGKSFNTLARLIEKSIEDSRDLTFTERVNMIMEFGQFYEKGASSGDEFDLSHEDPMEFSSAEEPNQ